MFSFSILTCATLLSRYSNAINMKQNKQKNQCFYNFSFSALRNERSNKSRLGGLQCPCIYRIELDFHLRDNSAVMNGQVKRF